MKKPFYILLLLLLFFYTGNDVRGGESQEQDKSDDCAFVFSGRISDPLGKNVRTIRLESVLGVDHLVTDLSGEVKVKRAGDLQVFKFEEVSRGDPNSFFLAFGRPNVYLAVPSIEKNGLDKYAAKSIKRGATKIETPEINRGFGQSGVLFLFKNVPDEALKAIREQMKKHEGQLTWTCVNANCQVLEDAGFTSGDRQLSRFYFPVSLLRTIAEDGLKYNGVSLEYELIRTSPVELERYALGVVGDELNAFLRHPLRSLGKSGIQKYLRLFFIIPKKGLEKTMFVLFGDENTPLEEVSTRIAQTEKSEDFDLNVSTPSRIGLLLRLLWGPHRLFEMVQRKADVSDYLPNKLKAFPKENPSFITKIKKNFLFSKPVVSLIRSQMAKSYTRLEGGSTSDFFNAMRTHTDSVNNKYNVVFSGNNIVLSRIAVRHKFVDWILTKHVLNSGYGEDVRFAGEIWKTSDGVIHLNNNSGTYTPSNEELAMAAEYLRFLFPEIKIVTENAY